MNTRALSAALAALAILPVSSLAQAPDRQDLVQLQSLVEDFARRESAGLPGTVTLAVTPFDSRLSLPRCAAPEPFIPPGGKLWGRSSVGVRCAAPVAWSVYAVVNVDVTGEYLVTARPIAQGETITAADFAPLRGDLAKLPAGAITDPQAAIGKQAAMSIGTGQPLRRDMLRAANVVVQGQSVKLVTQGAGFRVSADGRALGNASEGQPVQVRAPSGQTVSGIARAGGLVEVRF